MVTYEQLFKQVEVMGVNQEIVDDVTMDLLVVPYLSGPGDRIELKIGEETLGYLPFSYGPALSEKIKNGCNSIFIELYSLYRDNCMVGIKVNIYEKNLNGDYRENEEVIQVINCADCCVN